MTNSVCDVHPFIVTFCPFRCVEVVATFPECSYLRIDEISSDVGIALVSPMTDAAKKSDLKNCILTDF